MPRGISGEILLHHQHCRARVPFQVQGHVNVSGTANRCDACTDEVFTCFSVAAQIQRECEI